MHLFVECERVNAVFMLLPGINIKLGWTISVTMFIIGPTSSYTNRAECVLLNFQYGNA